MRDFFAICALICGFTLQANAAAPAAEYWQRDAALDAVRSNPVEQAARDIGDISTLADAAHTIARLERLEDRADWPLPAREAALLHFTRSLAGLPRDAVAPEVMQYLNTYQPRTQVPHDDHAGASEPLFNVPTAARGVENGWQRIEASTQAAKLLADDPAALLTLFSQTRDGHHRRGYLDALGMASNATVNTVQDAALLRISDQPGLTPLLAATATATGDHVAMRELLVYGRGPGLADAMERIADRLDSADLNVMLQYAALQAPAENASLAIAAWWPRLRNDAGARELLLALLADPALGSSATLALSSDPDVLTIKALQDMAAGDSLAARRAQRALALSRERPNPGRRP